MGSGPAIASISIGTKTIQKVRIRIIPFIFVLHLLPFLDRINITFAALTMIGAISKTTGSLYAGLALAGVFMFAAAILVLLLPKSATSKELDRDSYVKC